MWLRLLTIFLAYWNSSQVNDMDKDQIGMSHCSGQSSHDRLADNDHVRIFECLHYDVIKKNIFRVTDSLWGESSQRPVTRSVDVFFDLRLNKRLSKQSSLWFETPSRSLWRHCNVPYGISNAVLWFVLLSLTCDPLYCSHMTGSRALMCYRQNGVALEIKTLHNMLTVWKKLMTPLDSIELRSDKSFEIGNLTGTKHRTSGDFIIMSWRFQFLN